MTRNIEIKVPRLRHSPMPTMVPSVESFPIRKPAEAKIELTETGKQNYVLADTIATVKFNVTAFDLSKATISEITDQTMA